MKKPILDVEGLSKYFLSKRGANQAVNNFSFRLFPGEILGLVGQSGSGKSTVARSIMRLIKDVNGVVLLNDKVVSGKISRKTSRYFRQNVQMIFQDPSTSLNERQNIFSIVVEPLKTNKILRHDTNEFLAHHKQILETFELTLKDHYLNTQIDLLKNANSILTNVWQKVDKNLDELAKLDVTLTSEKLMSEIVLQYFLPIHEAYDEINLGLTNAVKDLLNFYQACETKIKNLDLSEDEIQLNDVKQKIEAYEKLHDKSKAKEIWIEKRDEINAELNSNRNQTRQIFNAFAKNYKKRIKYLKEIRVFTKTMPDFEKKSAEILKIQFLIEKLKNFQNKDFIIPPHILMDFEVEFSKEDPTRDWNNFVNKYLNKFAEETKVYRQEFSERFNKEKSIFDQVGGSNSNLSSETLSSLKNNLKVATNNFNLEKEKFLQQFKVSFSQGKTAFYSLRKQISSLENSAIKLKNEKRVNFLFKQITKKSTNKLEREKIARIFRENLSRTKIGRFNEKNSWQIIDEISFIYGVKFSPILKHKVKNILMKKKVMEALLQVGLKVDDAYRYPHEFSGGQKQRINIARALIMNPKVIIADEPIASLDVSIQAQVVNILVDLVREKKISMVFISHDLPVVEYIADSILIMHEGRIVEKGLVEKVFKMPVHPYTEVLFEAIPKISEPKIPFKYLNVNSSYIEEYNKVKPEMKKVDVHHYVLASQEQVEKWMRGKGTFDSFNQSVIEDQDFLNENNQGNVELQESLSLDEPHQPENLNDDVVDHNEEQVVEEELSPLSEFDLIEENDRDEITENSDDALVEEDNEITNSKTEELLEDLDTSDEDFSDSEIEAPEELIEEASEESIEEYIEGEVIDNYIPIQDDSESEENSSNQLVPINSSEEIEDFDDKGKLAIYQGQSELQNISDHEITPASQAIEALDSNEIENYDEDDDYNDYDEDEIELIPLSEPIESIDDTLEFKRESAQSFNSLKDNLIFNSIEHEKDDKLSVLPTFNKLRAVKPKPRIYKNSTDQILNELWLEKGVFTKAQYAKHKNKFRGFKFKTKKMSRRNETPLVEKPTKIKRIFKAKNNKAKNK